MSNFEDITTCMLACFDAKDHAREEAFRRSREVIRFCSSSIRSVHRGELEKAERQMSEAAFGL
ncbi:Uncharacterised protein [uncultured archaeon]|nr:Uncharacterised protein [uncultured archaeon]